MTDYKLKEEVNTDKKNGMMLRKVINISMRKGIEWNISSGG